MAAALDGKQGNEAITKGNSPTVAKDGPQVVLPRIELIGRSMGAAGMAEPTSTPIPDTSKKEPRALKEQPVKDVAPSEKKIPQLPPSDKGPLHQATLPPAPALKQPGVVTSPEGPAKLVDENLKATPVAPSTPAATLPTPPSSSIVISEPLPPPTVPSPTVSTVPAGLESALDLQKKSKFLSQSKLNLRSVEPERQQALKMQFARPINEMLTRVADGATAVVIDGKQQQLYVVKRQGNDFLFQYESKVSTSKAGFGRTKVKPNQDPTNQKPRRHIVSKTPEGLFSIGFMVRGEPGQVIEKGAAKVGKKTHRPVLVSSPNGGRKAEMLTTALSLKDANPIDWNRSAEANGIYIHGTNREARLGAKGSSGCVRVSNLDVKMLENLHRQNKAEGKDTYVYITKN